MGVGTGWQPLCSLLGGDGIEIEAYFMQISNDHAEFLDRVIDQPSNGIKSKLWMEEYLRQSNNRLGAIAEQVHRGEKIGSNSRDWMLNQVDFIVESLGTEPVKLANALRSGLLQLILAIANLDQHIRSEIQSAVEES
jgi:hypothetical protein